VPPTEGLRFAYASGYGADTLSVSAYWIESDADTFPYGAYHLYLERMETR